MKKMGGKFSHENIVKTSIPKFFNFTIAPEEVVYSWKESPGHDEGQIDYESNVMGVGIYCMPYSKFKPKSHMNQYYAYRCWFTAFYKGIDLQQLDSKGYIKYPNGTTSKDPTNVVNTPLKQIRNFGTWQKNWCFFENTTAGNANLKKWDDALKSLVGKYRTSPESEHYWQFVMSDGDLPPKI